LSHNAQKKNTHFPLKPIYNSEPLTNLSNPKKETVFEDNNHKTQVKAKVLTITLLPALVWNVEKS